MSPSIIPFPRVSVVGLGLMGGSLGIALRGAGVFVRGYDADAAVRDAAVSLGLVDEASDTLAAAVSGSALAVMATPVGAVPSLLSAIASLPSPPRLVTDLGSTKARIVAAYRALAPRPFAFVGGHPIAGTEKSGPAAAKADLYRGALVVLTPAGDEADVPSLAALWEAIGGRVVVLDPEAHDRLMAYVSHLPHVAAYALVHSLLTAEPPDVLETFVAGGFRDFTRIAASSPVMWRDICLNNTGPLLAAVDEFIANLAELRGMIAAGDGEAVEAFFRRARELRGRLVPGTGDGKS